MRLYPKTNCEKTGLLAYYSVDEVAQKSGLTKDQILRLGMSWTIVFSILEHAPRNYEEIDEFDTEDGKKGIRRKTNETMTLFGGEGPVLKLKYLGPEDIINVVTNDVPNRKTLVRALYETRELNPKKGKWFLNNPWRVSLADLVVSCDEWEYFSANAGKKIKYYLPLAKPEQVTLPWLVRNTSIGTWITTVGFAASVFGAGIYVGDSKIYNKLSNILKTPSATQMATPNQVLNASPQNGSP